MLQHIDNFSIYGTNVALMLNGVYSQTGGFFGGGINLINDPDGISSGKVLEMSSEGGGGGNHTVLRYALQTAAQPVVGVALRMWLTSLPPDTERRLAPIVWRDVSNNSLFSIRVDTTGRLELLSGAFDGTILFTTPAPVITANAWFHIEAKLTIAGASGNVEVRVEGLPVINFTTNTGAINIAQIAAVNDPTFISAVTPYYLKDYVIWDGSGSRNNNFFGSVQVRSLVPDSDVALNWTPTGAANGFSILDNIPPSDAAYISASTPPPAAYEGTLTNLPPNVTSVRGIMTYVRAAKTDGGDGSLQVSMLSSSSTAAGVDRPITVAQTYWRDIFEVDPATSNAWLPAAVDASRIKINRTI